MFLIYLYYTLKYVTVNDAIYEFVLILPQGYDAIVSVCRMVPDDEVKIVFTPETGTWSMT